MAPLVLQEKLEVPLRRGRWRPISRISCGVRSEILCCVGLLLSSRECTRKIFYLGVFVYPFVGCFQYKKKARKKDNILLITHIVSSGSITIVSLRNFFSPFQSSFSNTTTPCMFPNRWKGRRKLDGAVLPSPSQLTCLIRPLCALQCSQSSILLPL